MRCGADWNLHEFLMTSLGLLQVSTDTLKTKAWNDNVTCSRKVPSSGALGSGRAGDRQCPYQARDRRYLYFHRGDIIGIERGGTSRWPAERWPYIDRPPDCPLRSTSYPPARFARVQRKAFL